MSRRRLFVLAVILLASAAVVVGIQSRSHDKAQEVRIEEVARRNLVATVTASGQVEPETSVDIASDITGRIIRIPVEEGQVVEQNALLLQIDPTQFDAARQRAEGALSQARANALQARVNRYQAKRALDRALALRDRDPNLVSDEQLETAQQSYDVAAAVYESQQYQVAQAQASLREAEEQLSKTVLRAPMAGRITRLAVEEGEVALASTFSRETGLLMTIADLSVIQIKVRVDETDVVRLALGDSAEISIDAFPDTTFVGRVTKISQSAIQAAAAGSGDRAVDYDVEVTLDNPPPDIRPDLSGTAKVVTDTRENALSIPIIALTVREHAPIPTGETGAPDTGLVDTEGVFVVTDGVAFFRPVRVGIAGEEHFEVLSGLEEGDSIVAGPYQVIRDLEDSTAVRPRKKDDQPRRRVVSRAPRTPSRTTPEQVAASPVPAGSPDPTPPATPETAIPGSTGTETTDTPPTPTRFAVQVAAVRSPEAVDTWVRRLTASGYTPTTALGDDGLYKVRIGPFDNRQETISLARRLRWELGGTPFVVEVARL